MEITNDGVFFEEIGLDVVLCVLLHEIPEFFQTPAAVVNGTLTGFLQLSDRILFRHLKQPL